MPCAAALELKLPVNSKSKRCGLSTGQVLMIDVDARFDPLRLIQVTAAGFWHLPPVMSWGCWHLCDSARNNRT